MLYHYPLFECRPAVAKVGAPTRVAIIPEGNCRFFRDEIEYELWICGSRDDMFDYHDPIEPNVACKAEDGYLWFEYTFEREMEYSVRFREKGGSFTEVFMYAVKEDLYALRPLKGDLHTHSYYSDGRDDTVMVPAVYRENGYDFFALTDHNRYYTSEMLRDAYKDVKLGMCLLHGEEVHTPGSELHIVHIGGSESIADRYIHDPEGFEKEVEEIKKTMTHVPEQYRDRVAKAKWTCENAKKLGGIAIFAHPFWRSNIFNVSEDFCNLLFDENIFDAFELVGGVLMDENNLQLALWQEQWFKGNRIPGVGSSDSHFHAFMKGHFGKAFTIAFAKDNTEESILEAIRGGMCVAVELGTNEPTEAHVYGDFRLVQFAHFLFKYYFEATKRLYAGEGSMMRRYIREEIDGELLSAFAEEGDKFYKRFYGLMPVVTPSADRKAFYEKWRTHQIEQGPPTKGSVLYFYGGGKNKAQY